MTDPAFFSSPRQWREWLAANHDSAAELLVGFWKVGSGRPSMTWSDSVDAALCFGWIDGIRRRRDDDSYTIRFTPRRPGSIWSAVNVAKVEALVESGQMTAAGLVVFAQRREDRTGVYSHEREEQSLTALEVAALQAEEGAWEFYEVQPASYRRAVVHWLHGAKREETAQRRLALLVVDSAAGRRLAQFSPR